MESPVVRSFNAAPREISSCAQKPDDSPFYIATRFELPSS
jgi:hypothetical protein